jgi:hypothetical protein
MTPAGASASSHARDLARDLGFLARTKGEALQEIPEPLHDGDVAHDECRAEPTSLAGPRRRSHHKRVLAIAGLGTVLVVLFASGIGDSLRGTPSQSGMLGRPVDHSRTSNLRVRTHRSAKSATVVAATRHQRDAAVGTVVRATLPLGDATTAVGGQVTLRTRAIGAAVAVVAPAGGSGVTLQGTTTTKRRSASSTTMTAPRGSRPVVTTDTTPFSLPSEPVTLLHP